MRQVIFIVSRVSRSPLSPNVLFTRYRRLFPHGKTGPECEAKYLPHIIPDLRKSRAVPPLHMANCPVILQMQDSVGEFKNFAPSRL